MYSLFIRLDQYQKRPDWQEELSSDMKQSMQQVEIELCKTMDMVEIRGKCGRKVPVLIPIECREPMDYLVANRNKAGINEKNPFFLC